MNPTEQAAREREIFLQALEKPSPAEQQAYLNAACGADADLRARVERLLQAHAAATALLPGEPARPDSPSATPISVRPGDRIGRYKLLQQIGEGGCGVVYMAEQEEPVRRRVALKVIKLGMDTQSVVARFEAERQALAMMDHPNIARVFDAGTTDQGRPYFVMELVRGVPLTRFCDERNLRTRERLELFVQVCHAVQHAHQKGVIHRDLKPSNVLVTLHDDRPVPKVIDFGIAKATEGRLTDRTLFTFFEQFIGTPAYMSPEQAGMSGLDVDTRSDIYSLGVLLYELLAGQPPFDPGELARAGVDEIRRRIREVDPPRPSIRFGTLSEEARTTTAQQRQMDPPRLQSLLAGDLDWIVMKCLEKDRTRRYDTANGLAADLQRHLSSEPVVARPPSVVYRLQKSVRRNRLAYAAGAAVGLSLLVGLVVSGWMFLQQRRAYRQETLARAAAQQERARADAEAKTAREARNVAESQTKAAEKNLAQLNVAEGQRRVEEGDYFGALRLFAEAFKLEESDPDRAALHQTRLASVFQHCPKLVNIWSAGSNLTWAAFTRDGSRLVTANSLSTNQAVARVWDPVTGTPLTPPMEHAGNIHSIQWSRDEARLVTASADKTARVWDSRTGTAFSPPLRHSSKVTRATFDSDGNRIATTMGGVDEGDTLGVIVWNAPWQELGQQVTADFRGILRGLSPLFSADGHWLIDQSQALKIDDNPGPSIQQTDAQSPRAGVSGFKIKAFPNFPRRMWNFWPPGETPLQRTLQSMFDTRRHHLSPDSKRLFTLSSLLNGELRQADTYELITRWDNESIPLFGEFSPSSTELATASMDFSVRVWDAATGAPISQPILHRGNVTSLAFSSDGRRLVTAGEDRLARVWDPRTGLPLSPWLPVSGIPIQLSFCDDGSKLAVMGMEGQISIWDLRTDSIPQAFWTGSTVSEHQPVVTASAGPILVASSPASNDPEEEWAFFRCWDLDSSAMTVPAFQGSLYEWTLSSNRLWAPQNGYQKRSHKFDSTDLRSGIKRSFQVQPDSEDSYISTHFNKDKSSIAVWVKNSDLPIRILATATGGEISRLVPGGSVEEVSFSPEGDRLLVCGGDAGIQLWQCNPARKLQQLSPTNSTFGSAWFAAKGDRILLTGREMIEVWDGSTGRRICGPIHRGGRSYTTSWDLRWAVAYGPAGFELFDLNDGRQVVRNSDGRETILGATFDPGGTLMATVSSGREVRLWHVPSGELAAPPFRSDSRLTSVQFSFDGRRIFTQSSDFAVLAWDMPAAESRPSDDWIRLAQFLQDDGRSGAGIGPESWEALRQRFPAGFSLSPRQARTWVRHEIWRAELRRDWVKAAGYLTRWLEDRPEDTEMLERRAIAYSRWANSVSPDSPNAAEQARNLREKSLKDIERTIAQLQLFPDLATPVLKPLIGLRAEVLWQLGQRQAAAADYAELRNIPPRSQDTDPNLIDLTAWMNLPLRQTAPARMLTTPAGTVFDLRGAAEVTHEADCCQPPHPEMRDMALGRFGRRLHFLLGALDIGDQPGLEVATIIVRLANGQTHRIPIKSGEDVWEFQAPAEGRTPPKNATIAWTKLLDEDSANPWRAELFERVWENPTPDSRLESLDILSAEGGGRLLVYAITVEP
ncbi:MAG: protein kinase [Verrucomicrobiae bacterium]|nr:protein kinase [Verrucomicrobiae bacterium]